MMKKLMLALCLLLSSTAYADGPYDGAWAVPNGNFASFYQTGNEVLVLLLEQDLSGWVPMLGSINGNVMTGTSLAGLSLQITVTFATENSATVTIVSCAPVQECAFSAGTQFNITRIL